MSKRRSSFWRRWRRYARMHPTLAGNLRWTAALAAVLIAGLVLILLGWRQRLKQPSPVEEDAVRAAADVVVADNEHGGMAEILNRIAEGEFDEWASKA